MKQTILLKNTDVLLEILSTEKGIFRHGGKSYKYKTFSKGYAVKSRNPDDCTVIIGECFDYNEQKRMLLSMKESTFDRISEKLSTPYTIIEPVAYGQEDAES